MCVCTSNPRITGRVPKRQQCAHGNGACKHRHAAHANGRWIEWRRAGEGTLATLGLCSNPRAIVHNPQACMTSNIVWQAAAQRGAPPQKGGCAKHPSIVRQVPVNTTAHCSAGPAASTKPQGVFPSQRGAGQYAIVREAPPARAHMAGISKHARGTDDTVTQRDCALVARVYTAYQH